MTRLKRYSFLFAFFLLSIPVVQLCSQEILTPQDLWAMVSANHPLARQAALLRSEGEQALLYARGAFEPKLDAFQEQKTFDGKDYFTYGGAEVKMPTTFGATFKAGFDWTNADGLYLSPERNIPEGGQAILGVELPLLRGLFMDESRADWRQAQTGVQRYQQLARELRNTLYQETHKAYWNWAWVYNAQRLAIDALRYSEERLVGIRQSFEAGDYPAIDTLEAYLQVQSWQLAAQDAQIDLQHVQAKMQTLLWNESGQPMVWNDNWEALPLGSDAYPMMSRADLELQLNNHPALRAYSLQLTQLQQERRWKSEMFKPELTVNFNLLGDNTDFNPGTAEGVRGLVTENYKWGFRFSYPLFLRKARAGLTQTDIKIAQTEWKLSDKQQQLNTKLEAYWQEWQIRQRQVQVAASVVANYRTLLDAEQIKFELGESSVFLLNSRQQKLLEARLKQLKAQAELQKAIVALQYTVGVSQ